MQDASNSTNPEYPLIREVLKKLSTTQRSLEERLKALGVILNEEEEEKSSFKIDPKQTKNKKP
jgi:hypothetical protein